MTNPAQDDAAANVFDVAAYILQRHGSMTTMKLQKLVYYAQAWSLVWDERPLFKAPIEAWANGPVVPALYRVHRGMFRISASDLSRGDASVLDKKARDTIDSVLRFYGDKEPQWLSDLTHREKPWRRAREKAEVHHGERGSARITRQSMYDYYASL